MSNGGKIVDDVPWSDQVTDYDREHFVVYVRLLDAERAGLSDDEMACGILGIDPGKEPNRAKQVLANHLRRAHWMTSQGYRNLLK